MSISKGWIIFFIILIVAFLLWLFWYKNKKSEKKKDAVVVKQPVSEEKVNEQQEGITIPSIHAQNYKGKAEDIFYLSYVTESGSEIEEISKEKYDQFIKDNPSGTAQGNVIKKYL